MANLNESEIWAAGVYQIETTDPVIGGPGGISNLQGAALANRTAYLKAQVVALEEAVAARAPIASPALTGAPTAPSAALGTRGTRIATMESFATEFGGLMEGSGWARLPSGLIVQWGNLSAQAVAEQWRGTDAVLPIAFPNAHLCALCQYNGQTPPVAINSLAAHPLSRTTVRVTVFNATFTGFNGVTFLCIGY